MKGIVKWFSPYRRFGFIKSEGKDYFVHKADIEKNLNLDEGDKVSFETEEDPKGTKAVKVKKISERSKK
ncbi:unnamed protein product [marine sediment metagenome]|uniref:CSD domain-containing protein n=1 Tax=marine sediment metagenome TaxID=412755 RepID=X1RZY7_9ZZZZ